MVLQNNKVSIILVALLCVTSLLIYRYNVELNLLNSEMDTKDEIIENNKQIITGKARIISSLETDNTELSKNITNLMSSNNELLTQVNVLEIDLIEYDQEIVILESNIDELETQVNVINIKVQKKENEIIGYEAQLENLENRYNILETKYNSQLQNEKLNIGHNLTSFYDFVRYNHGPAGDKYTYLNMDREKLRFAEILIRHDSGISEFPDIEPTYFNIIGIHSYDLAKKYIDLAISYCEINENDTSTTKIAKILEFINEKLTYQLETDELYRAPVETLSIGSGDCDDYSILAATLFEYVGIDAALAIYENPEHEWHMMTLIHLDDINYKHWYWTDLTYLGLDEGKWIDIDPQRLITEQGDDYWFEQWDIREARDISIINGN